MNLSYVHAVETTLEYALTHSGVSVLITARGFASSEVQDAGDYRGGVDHRSGEQRGADLRVAQEETTC